ncbi:hypothetical protein MCHIJ_37450 [Mycolicibacterium chitae]|nr:hypothetical protein MCHIJ_37450 [Mycolicibacterium chitae]
MHAAAIAQPFAIHINDVTSSCPQFRLGENGSNAFTSDVSCLIHPDDACRREISAAKLPQQRPRGDAARRNG